MCLFMIYLLNALDQVVFVGEVNRQKSLVHDPFPELAVEYLGKCTSSGYVLQITEVGGNVVLFEGFLDGG